MFSHIWGKVCFLTLVTTLVLLAGIAGALSQAERTAQAQNEDGNAPEAKTGPNIESMDVENVRSLMVDLAAFHACDYLQGRIMALSSGGASAPADRKIVTGNFRIDACSTEQVDPQRLRFTVSGEGWRWIARQRQRLGAEFELDEYVKFLVRVSMVGTFDLAYARQDHIVTVWFVPTQPVEVDFQVKGDVDVDTESIWSSIVGQGAEIVGGSPEERALQDIRQKGSRKFRSRLSSGLTMVVDLCTGQRYSKFGTLPAGQLPDQPPEPGERPLLAHNDAVLHKNGMLLFGPFETSKPVIARLDVREGGEVHASMVCQEDARRLADSYINGNELPEVDALAETTVSPGNPAYLEVPSGAGCPVVLLTRPVRDQTDPVTYSFRVYHEGAERKPLVNCE